MHLHVAHSLNLNNKYNFSFSFYMKPKTPVGTGGGKVSQLINPTTFETIYNTTHTS